jgi:hypothetical protein
MESLAVDSDHNVSFDLDTYKILIAYLKKNNRADIVDLGPSTQTEMYYV